MIQMSKKVSVSLMALVLLAMTASAGTNSAKSAKTSGINWNPVMDAIIQVESEGNPRAVSGNSVGAMQITPWNGGVKYSVRATNKYYKKVMALMK